MTNQADAAFVTLTLRLKVRPESYAWLNAAAAEVNETWNFCNERAATVLGNLGRWLSGFDLCYETAGSTRYMKRVGTDTIQRVCTEYAAKRNAVRKQKLRWRVSGGARRSLGWVPFKAASVKRKGKQLRFAGKTFRVFEAERLEGVTWKQGCFAQDAVGDWWLCLPVERAVSRCVAPREAVGIDLGLTSVATTSDGERLEAARFYRDAEERVAHAQRRGHKRQAKRVHRRAANPAAGCSAQVQSPDRGPVSEHRRWRRECAEAGEDAAGKVRARQRVGNAQADVAVQRRARQQVCRSRQRAEHLASLFAMRFAQRAAGSKAARCESVDV